MNTQVYIENLDKGFKLVTVSTNLHHSKIKTQDPSLTLEHKSIRSEI